MSVTTEQAIVSAQASQAMMHALGEGTLGRAFRAFSMDNPKATIKTVHVAQVFWDISEYNPAVRTEHNIPTDKHDLVGIGAFAHAFTEVVSQMAEPYLPVHVNHFGHNAWMVDAWDWFAQNVCK